jgi:hypothetical protein
MFEDLKVLADNEEKVISNITAAASTQNLHPTSVVSRARTSEKTIDNLKRTSFPDALIDGSYDYATKLLTGCVAENVSSN